MGVHVLLNLYECLETNYLQSLELFTPWATDMLIKSGAEIVNLSSYQFEPKGSGFTYLALLTTSHFSIHTWPEHGSAAIDVFTCGSQVNTNEIVGELIRYFGSVTHTAQTVLR